MPIYSNAIVDVVIYEGKIQLPSNTWTNNQFDVIKYPIVYYQRGTYKIHMSIPVKSFINDNTKIINNLSPPYRHVAWSVKII